MDKTRRTATTAAAALVVGRTAIRRRRRRNADPLVARGMCFRMASLADIDAGRDCECVVL